MAPTGIDINKFNISVGGVINIAIINGTKHPTSITQGVPLVPFYAISVFQLFNNKTVAASIPIVITNS